MKAGDSQSNQEGWNLCWGGFGWGMGERERLQSCLRNLNSFIAKVYAKRQ